MMTPLQSNGAGSARCAGIREAQSSRVARSSNSPSPPTDVDRSWARRWQVSRQIGCARSDTRATRRGCPAEKVRASKGPRCVPQKLRPWVNGSHVALRDCGLTLPVLLLRAAATGSAFERCRRRGDPPGGELGPSQPSLRVQPQTCPPLHCVVIRLPRATTSAARPRIGAAG